MTVVEIGEGPVPAKIGVVASAFNQAITEKLLDGATSRLESLGVAEIVVLRVPGALELAIGAHALFEAGCEAVVAVGAVILGETDHYDIVAHESARALTDVAVRWGRAVANSVLTVREYQQAVDRSRPGAGNKGAEAAEAAVRMARLLASLHRSPADRADSLEVG